MKKITLLTAIILVSLSTFAQTWKMDKAHARLGFSVSHMMVSDVEGGFRSFDAKVVTTQSDFTDAVIELTADAGSVNTENEKRDGHLKSADFFDVAKYPTLTFKSKSFKKTDGKNYKLTGDLTMHGITKPVELAVIYNGTATAQNKKIAGFKVSGFIKRTDFGIGASIPSAMLGDEITITANIELNESLVAD